LGHCPFTAATRVRIPYGTPLFSLAFLAKLFQKILVFAPFLHHREERRSIFSWWKISTRRQVMS
ncbi:hypothetical protein, partial [Acetobacter persici]|uniref:hypothetical protein n=1 Tax=Acetobacter persici TaxID=1076596 RepID=UPI0039E7B913